jgi:Holliday junction DNA helicase RuvA
MIASLRGVLIDKSPNQAIVDVSGVGYDVTIPVSTFSVLPPTGGEVQLRIHTHVREDAIALFGFASPEEKAVFEKLIGVSGIGPKLAVTVLSGLAAIDLIRAIRNAEVERLVRIPGVGKKTAERMVLELKDKLVAPASQDGAAAEEPSMNDVDRDAVSALLNLGCARPAAETAVRKARGTARPGEGFDSLFRRALEFVR